MPRTSNATRTRGGVAVSASSSRPRYHSTAPAVAHAHAAPDFDAVNAAARTVLPALLARWLPDSRREGNEWVARNPLRHDRERGSFSINLATGRWADFATGDKGGDPVSLAAYLFGLTQGEAARELAAMLGLEGRR